ncbi:hypothetical protein LOZ12_003113 [Ophidiomyces ophidiicola]|nr:hypothetical protein LOZ62_003017 [Ophidiomyces ophidiicola]KAI2052063.1 hypothetical protein LOZ38_002402 [Ophidiomyces ophidiicola]KAI2054706.1 hypothetical protein LOZ44_002309 [Ophidiomyces ophidiicola]KAI2077550.1 hypothetical protein LOZ39_002115 [Ophidiomyces ophidiicola]KAI2081645.1 hypothetical protein LOZ37_001177 [Ophidiomyces ophidiicola]
MEPDPSLQPRKETHGGQHHVGVSNSRRRASDPGLFRICTPLSCGDAGHGHLSNEAVGAPNIFHNLPENVIERILYAVDPNVFASLAVLNRKWRCVSASSKLYYHHLLACRVSGSASQDPAAGLSPSDNLNVVRSRFLREARRNTFEVFLRPKRTLVNLISASANSSSAFPQGEAFRFEFSTSGRELLALSSSRIFVIELATDPISIRYELKPLRRPLTATIAGDGRMLAVACSELQAHIYTLANGCPDLIQSIVLNENPRTLAFSPDAAVLAIAYSGGIEVHEIGENVLPTAHRAARCQGIQSLTFCHEGSMLLGTSNDFRNSNLTIISPALCIDPDPNLTMRELENRMWTSQILFPQVHTGNSHAVLLPSIRGDNGSPLLVGYHVESKAFRLASIDDPNTSTIYFVGPGPDIERDEPKPSFLPTACASGEHLAAGFYESELWIYGIPNLEDREITNPSVQSAPNIEKEPPWQSNLAPTNFNRIKKTIEGTKFFVHGSPLRLPEGVSGIKWVQGSGSDHMDAFETSRLVAVAPGGVRSWLGSSTGDTLPIDGGRILVLDFAYSLSNGREAELTIEVGEAEPIQLPEPGSNLDQQVELERRRSRMNRIGGLGDPRTCNIPLPEPRIHYRQTTASSNRRGAQNIHLLENPYNNSSPRSHDTLSRAATAAANHLDPRYENARQIQIDTSRSVAPLPQESDGDNWSPPPPPYTPNAESPLPEHLQRTLMPPATDPTLGNEASNFRLRRSRTSRLAQAVIHRSSTWASRDSSSQIANFQLENAPLVSRRELLQLPSLNTNQPSADWPSQTQSATLPSLDPVSAFPRTYSSTNSRAPQFPAMYEESISRAPMNQLHSENILNTDPPVPVLNAAQAPLAPLVVPPTPEILPISRFSPDTPPLRGSPENAESRRSWYTVQPQVVPLVENPARPLTPFHDQSVPSGLRTHSHNDHHAGPEHALGGRDHRSQRSRSRSHRPLPLTNHGLRDRHTGRIILSSPSETRINETTPAGEWLEPGNSRKKEGKCIMM